MNKQTKENIYFFRLKNLNKQQNSVFFFYFVLLRKKNGKKNIIIEYLANIGGCFLLFRGRWHRKRSLCFEHQRFTSISSILYDIFFWFTVFFLLNIISIKIEN